MRLARSASVEEREKKRRKFAMKRAETINFDNQSAAHYRRQASHTMKVYDGGEDELVDVDLEDGEAAVLSTRNDTLSKSLQVRGSTGELMSLMTSSPSIRTRGQWPYRLPSDRVMKSQICSS